MSETEGASIGYRLVDGETQGPWRLYSKPLRVAVNTVLEAKAIRYGYTESSITRVHGKLVNKND